MNKQTMADKVAEKTFHMSSFQKSWTTHMQAFGPILQPAFVDDYQAKTHLCAALNLISNLEVKKGYEKLNSIKDACKTAADKAAWLFFVGMCFELSGMKAEMLSCYQQAAECGHHFYLPYLKVAKSAHNDAVFEIAEDNYRVAIQCLNETKLGEQEKIVLASIYTNLASCLTMMHRYLEAEEALTKSKKILPEQFGRYASEAILYAAMKESEKVVCALEELKKQSMDSYTVAQEMTDKILNDRHPHFSTIEIDREQIQSFWNWVLENENDLKSKLNNQEYDDVFYMFQNRLKVVFPFMERDIEFTIESKDCGYKVHFADFYVIALRHGYKELLKECPEQLKPFWEFKITH